MKKLFVISFEGLNYKLLTEFMEMGNLPNFKRVSIEGGLEEINCSRIPYEASGLVSALSGKEDSEHGVFSYWRTRNRDYRPEVYQSEDVKHHMFWNQRFCKGYRVGIVNVFGTHPVYKVDGVLISYAMNRTLRYAFPPDLMRRLTKSGFGYVQDMGAFYKNDGKESLLKQVIKVEKMRHAICQELYKDDLDVYVINYTCIDRVCHFFMDELKDDAMPLEEKAVYRMYQLSDEILGDILQYVDAHGSELILFSSVGFGELEKFVEINPYLEKEGFLKRVSERGIDFDHTLAFEAPQGVHGININTEDFYARGIVKADNYNRVLSEVADALRQMINPYNTKPMFAQVVKGKEFYQGNKEAPDLILEPYDWNYLPYGDNYWADIVGRHNQTGWHRNKSVWGRMGYHMNQEAFQQVSCLKDIYREIERTILI